MVSSESKNKHKICGQKLYKIVSLHTIKLFTSQIQNKHFHSAVVNYIDWMNFGQVQEIFHLKVSNMKMSYDSN